MTDRHRADIKWRMQTSAEKPTGASTTTSTPTPLAPPRSSFVPANAVDEWMTRHPWHPRVTPFALYGVFLLIIGFVRPVVPAAYPALYTFQCVSVGYMLWRYRKLLPELTLTFHWSAVVVGIGVCVGWVLLGWAMAGELGVRVEAILQGQPLGMIDYAGKEAPHFATTLAGGPVDFRHPRMMGPTVGWIALWLRLAGMSIIVPLFEELFIRSLILRSFNRFRPTAIGAVQILQDMPIIGDWLVQTDLGRRAHRHHGLFEQEFFANPLGKLTFFGVAVSTAFFTISHIPRDWPGAIFCGLAYCGLLWFTNRAIRKADPQDSTKLGLGPVVWAHGITNALLWIYTLQTGDWQFL